MDVKLDIKENVSTKYNLLTLNLAEIIDPENQIKKNLENQSLKIYWGTAPTGKPHLGYLIPLLKIRDFLLAGAHVKILFADIHAMLDSFKSGSQLIEMRIEYYRFIIGLLLGHLGVDFDHPHLEYVVGSSFQKSPAYVQDLYQLLALTSVKTAQHAGAEVVKQSKDPLLSSLIYPLMQMLDEEYLKVNAQLGGIDQRKIFTFARDNTCKLGYNKKSYLMNPLIPGLTKNYKMSCSDPLSKIDFDDDNEMIREKIKRAFSIDGSIEKNALVAIIKYIIFELYPKGFLVKREKQYGGDIFYDNYELFKNDFINLKVGSADLKPTIAELLIQWIDPIRFILKTKTDLLNIAYPENNI